VRAGSLLLAAGLLGCEVYSTPPLPACPGQVVATFTLSSPLAPPDGGLATDCAFRNDPNQVFPSVAFTAALHVDADGGAALCRSVPHVRHWLGTFQADRLDVSDTDVGGGTPSCSCALSVVERVVGDVQRDGGVPVAFSGELVDSVSPADPAELDGGTADGGVCGCGLPCEIRYAPLLGAATDGG
jgi:hypothetical protein